MRHFCKRPIKKLHFKLPKSSPLCWLSPAALKGLLMVAGQLLLGSASVVDSEKTGKRRLGEQQQDPSREMEIRQLKNSSAGREQQRL